jgi:hypothetical protein
MTAFQRYMLIDVTTPEETKLLKISDRKRTILWGHIYKAQGRKVIAPPVEGKGLSKLDQLSLSYFYWNLLGAAPPDDYAKLVENCMHKLALAVELDDATEGFLMKEIHRLGIDLENPSAKTQPTEPKPKREDNGIPARPKATTATGLVWQIADELSVKANGEIPDRKELITACEAEGINPATAQVQFGKWKKAREVGSGI